MSGLFNSSVYSVLALTIVLAPAAWGAERSSTTIITETKQVAPTTPTTKETIKAAPTTTTTRETIKTTPAIKTGTVTPAATAEQLRRTNTEPTAALRTMIQTHRISLRSADFYLANAKYSTVERAEAVRDNYTASESAASLLRSKVTAQDAYLQLRCWHYPPRDAATAVIGVYPAASAEEVAQGMAAEGASIDEIAAFLMNAGYTAEQIADFFGEIQGYSNDQLLAYFLELIASDPNADPDTQTYVYEQLREKFGNDFSAAGNWLIGTVGMTWEKAAEILTRAGYTAKQVVNWLKNAVGASAWAIANFLKNVLGWTAKNVVKVLREVGFSFSEIWDAVKAKFGSTTKNLIVWLKAEGATAAQIARLLINKVGATASQVFDRLLEAGYSMQDILDVLANVFEWTKEQILALLIAKNQVTDAVLTMLNDMFGA